MTNLDAYDQFNAPAQRMSEFLRLEPGDSVIEYTAGSTGASLASSERGLITKQVILEMIEAAPKGEFESLTLEEIGVRQIGRIDGFVRCVGTAAFLPEVRIVAVEPADLPVLLTSFRLERTPRRWRGVSRRRRLSLQGHGPGQT